MDGTQVLPWTVEALTTDLVALGIRPGSTLLTHTSLSSIGYAAGGAHAVVLALLDVLGPEGTLVVPTHLSELSDPGRWERPPVPEAWWETIRDHMPAFDSRLTATYGMGAVPDTGRHLPGALRSDHPAYSFSAFGPKAEMVPAGHMLSDGHMSDTSLHLAEHRSGWCGTTRQAAPVLVDGRRHWVEYEELDVDTEDFVEVGAAASAAGLERKGTVGCAAARLLSQPALVDFATAWIRQHRA
jgi:aminoglycoside 3-N-acetyltransferase